MPDHQTTTSPATGPIRNDAVQNAQLAVDPRATNPARADAILPSGAQSFVAQPLPSLLPSAQNVTPRIAVELRTYKVKLLTSGGAPLKQERCILVVPGDRNYEAKTNDAGVVEFIVAAPPPSQSLDTRELRTAPPLLLIPDVLEEFSRPDQPETLFPGVPMLQELKHQLDTSFRYRHGDRVSHPILTLQSGATEIRLSRLTEQEKFEHFRWSYVSNRAIYATANPGDYITRNARWEWGVGALCNQHVNFFLGYWFNYNSKFTASGSGTDTAYLPLLDCGNGKFPYHGETKVHRGYREFVEPLTDFHAATHMAAFNDLEFPGRQEIKKPAKKQDGTVVTAEDGKTVYDVLPERYVKYIRLCQFIDWETRKLNAKGLRLVEALADFNVYSVAEFTDKDRRANALARTRTWLKQNKALAHLQCYTVLKGKQPVSLADLTDAEIDGLSEKLLWEILWKLDDDRAEDAALLARLRAGLNIDHHAGILVKRAVGGGPLTSSAGPVALYKFSADSSPTILKMKDFVGSVCTKGEEHSFTHYAFWKLKPLRAGGFAPEIVATPGASGSVDIDAPPRFIYWR